MEKNENNNKYKIAILMLFIVIVICFNFFSLQKYQITSEIIICLLLLVILSLAELFDNLNIPKLLSLSKNIKEVKKENDDLKEANIKLLEQVVSIKSSNSQTIYFPTSFSTIGSSNIDDINKTEENCSSNEQSETENFDNSSNQRILAAERRKYRDILEICLLKKVLNNETNNPNIQYEVKLINNKPIEDNLMKSEIRFDALKSDGESNVFYEVKLSPFWMDYPYQLHYMLRMIELYQEANKCASKLVLILPRLDEDLKKILFNMPDNRFTILKEKIASKFEPAIKNGLLEILQLDITKKELDKYINEKEKK